MAQVRTAGRAPGYARNPGHRITLEPSPRRVRVVFNGETVADSARMKLMHESRHLPVYYFPLEDVRMELMSPTDHSTHCPYKGDASYWSIGVGERCEENVMWSYETPFDEHPDMAGHGAFYWGRLDHWYEEDEEVFVHARDPYKRIDTIASSRAVQVRLGGRTVAESTRTHFLFETGLPVRYYLPREDVRMDLLRPSDSRTRCPYKGEAVYWSAEIDGEMFEDIVWSYPDPIPECPKIRDLMCFYGENVDAISVEGIAVEKPVTPWSRK